MDELRGHLRDLGLADVATYRASGNVIFQHSGTDRPALEREIEAHLEGALGYDVPTFVRSLAATRRIVQLDVATEAREEGFTPYVIFRKDEASPDVADALSDLETPDDRFVVRGHEVLYLRRGRLTDSSIGPADLERALGRGGYTRRKLTTVERIVEKFTPPDGPA